MDPETRLVTLVGPGGTGKTRLALQVAAEVLETFPDGVWWVPLAGVTDPALVPQAIAVPLGVRENAGRPVLATLAEHLTSRRTLLFLDNAEHLLPAVPQISSLLDAAPGLVMLVTSREPLRLRAEHEFPVTPLPLPSPGSGLSAKAALAFPAVRLFVERAHVVTPTFRLDADNVADVIAICQRLDGLPLAIELAAPQVRFLSPMALFARLNQGLAILTGQTRDLPARQRTMRATIAWSYDLLSTEERALFRRVSVFVGGFTLEAVAAVVSGEENLPFDALDKVAALVDHSLVRPVETDDPEPRFELLETIRAYGRERLAESGDETPVRNAHAAYFLTLAAEACLAFEGSKRSNAREQVAREFDNLRAALSWAVERGDAEVAQRLATHLARFWVVLGLVGEGRAWLDRAVALDGPSLPETRADALSWAAQFASHQDAVDHAERRAMEAMAVAREGSYDRGVAMALHQFGQVAHRRGDLAKAAAYFEDAVARFRRLNESIFEGIALRDLGVVAGAQDEHDRATAHHEEALAVWRKLDHPWGVPAALRDLADEALCRGDVVAALPLYREALGRWRLLGEKLHVAGALLGPATVALEGGQAEHAARLLGASAALHEAIGVVPPDLPCDLGDGSERARAALGEAAFETAWATGRAFSVEEAIVDALAVAAPAPSSDLSPGSGSRDPVSPRRESGPKRTAQAGAGS